MKQLLSGPAPSFEVLQTIFCLVNLIVWDDHGAAPRTGHSDSYSGRAPGWPEDLTDV